MPSGETKFAPLHVLRVCSVSEAPADVLRGRGVRFDPAAIHPDRVKTAR